MVAAACHPAQLEVALYLPPFALGADAPVPVRGGVASLVDVASAEQRVVFAVGRYYAAEFCAEFHCAEHHLPVLDSASVVRERDALPSERLEVDKFRSLAPFGYRCVGEHLYHGVPVYYLLLCGESSGAVRYGVEVRHRAYRGVAAPRRGHTAAAYGLLVGISGLAQVHVQVYEAAAYEQAGGVDDARVLPGLYAGACPDDDPFPCQYVGAAAPEQYLFRHILTKIAKYPVPGKKKLSTSPAAKL